MLQNGTSRELLELWAPDSRNGLIVTGYSVEGTPARVSFSLFWDLLAVVSFACVYTNQWTSFLPLPSRVNSEASTSVMKATFRELR
jgi:Cft2 family RNA processing exonuclease